MALQYELFVYCSWFEFIVQIKDKDGAFGIEGQYHLGDQGQMTIKTAPM